MFGERAESHTQPTHPLPQTQFAAVFDAKHAVPQRLAVLHKGDGNVRAIRAVSEGANNSSVAYVLATDTGALKVLREVYTCECD